MPAVRGVVCGARAGGGRKRVVGRSEDGGMEGVVRCMRQGAARAGSAGVRAYGRARWADDGGLRHYGLSSEPKLLPGDSEADC